MASRILPVLDPATLPATPSAPRHAAPPDERLAEFTTDDLVMPRFHIWTLGCQMNSSDSEEMAGALLAAGCGEAPSLDDADLVVINTCAIREAAEAKVVGRQGHLARLKADRPGMRVVMTGCAVREENRAGLSRRYPAVDMFLRPDEEPELTARLGLVSPTGPGWLGWGSGRAPAAAVETAGVMPFTAPRDAAAMPLSAATAAPAATPQRAAAMPLSAATAAPAAPRPGAAVADRLPATRMSAVAEGRVARESTIRAWVPIIYGCDKTCTYCIVPFSRGPERSRPFDEIVDEVRGLAAAGYREVMLLGQNVNSYGHDLPREDRFQDVRRERELGRRIDLDGRPDIAELLRAIDAIRDADGGPAIPRVRFITSHPWDLGERLVSAMAECDSVCEHLHLPVQSGSDPVLRRMGRQYTVESYEALVARLRAAIPGICLTTDVIVGFCGETEEQFEETLGLLRRVRFDTVYAAAFSPRPGTPAARLVDDVPADEKRRRLNALLAVQEEIGFERNRTWEGRTTRVLLEEIRPPRSHDHDHGDAAAEGLGDADVRTRRPDPAPGLVRLAGRNRENKLVHVDGMPDLLGHEVDVRIDRAGPYALVGSLVGSPVGSAGS